MTGKRCASRSLLSALESGVLRDAASGGRCLVDDGRGGANIPTLETAALGLLALMIGLTFAMVLERFDARRNAVVMEAIAIGTTALRARLLPEPHRAESVKLLKEYVQIRLGVISTGTSLVELENAIDRSNELLEGLWQQAMAMAAKDKALVPTGLFIQA